MTTTTDATTETAWATPLESPWSQTREELAAEIAAGLRRIADMAVARPDIAPLLADVFRNLMLPTSGTRNPAGALAALCRATTTNGGAATQAKYSGVNLDFSPAVRMWVMTNTPLEPDPAVVESVPESPVDDTAAEVQDDADDTPTVPPTELIAEVAS